MNHRGEKNPGAKLTEVDAKMILKVYFEHALSPQGLVKLVGDRVKVQAIRLLIKGATWKHLPRPKLDRTQT